MTAVIAAVSAALKAADGAVRSLHPGELTLDADAQTLPALADRITYGLEARLARVQIGRLTEAQHVSRSR